MTLWPREEEVLHLTPADCFSISLSLLCKPVHPSLFKGQRDTIPNDVLTLWIPLSRELVSQTSPQDFFKSMHNVCTNQTMTVTPDPSG